MVVQAVADLMTRDVDGDYLAIIGCGNPNRSDDGVGPAVLAYCEAGRCPIASSSTTPAPTAWA